MRPKRINARQAIKRKKFNSLRPEDMILVKKGKELRGKNFAWYIGLHHPHIINKVHVGMIHHSMKYQVIKWIEDGRLYLRKDGIDEG